MYSMGVVIAYDVPRLVLCFPLEGHVHSAVIALVLHIQYTYCLLYYVLLKRDLHILSICHASMEGN